MGREHGRHRRRRDEGGRFAPHGSLLVRLGSVLLALLIGTTAATTSGATAAPSSHLTAAVNPTPSDTQLQPEPDLDHLQADLDAARQQVVDATNAATAAAGRVVAAQIARNAAQLDVDRARAQLRDQVRRTFVAGPVAEMPAWIFSSDPNGAELLPEMRQRAVTKQVDQVTQLRDAVTRLDDASRTLTAQRDEATKQAATAVLAADRARRLLDDGQRIAANNAAVRARLAERKRVLDALNAALVASLAKVQQPTQPPGPLPPAVDALPDGTRPDASAATQATVLKLLDATPPGQLPAGYRPTGQVLQGTSSWYGPGFVGSPTSSGVPYDPEQLTCAMLSVPLGTVVRVTTAAGASVTLLVNDHGPYVGDRIMDVSQRANRILNLGLGQVRIEVLERTS